MANDANRISATENRNLRLIAEVSAVCPLCGRKLQEIKNGRNIKLFDVAHIYPHKPTVTQVEALKDIEPPSNVEALENLIALCKSCHKTYDTFTTKEEYLKVLALKQELSARYESRMELAEIPADEDIREVLNGLEHMPEGDLKDLRMDPLAVKKKIPNGVFQNKVLQLATGYYSYLREQFQGMEGRRTHKFAKIASQVSLSFRTAQEYEMIQEQIFDQIVEWMERKTGGRRAACEAVVAYFVQDCEVFDALPE